MICSGILTWLILYLSGIIYVTERRMNNCSSLEGEDNDKVKYIFNLERWRYLLLNDRKYFVGNVTLCDIPSELQMISNGICRMYNIDDCKRLPCQMIYSSPSTLEDIKCFNDGRVWKKIDDKSGEKQSDILCKRTFTLDLFLKKSDDYSYPSLIGDPITPLSDDLYIKVLNNNYRSCDSIWGFNFNFESISHYPWAADRNKLKLFDVTFGYDRSLYDFIPAPWLFNYVERLKFNEKRLSLQTVMETKKPIRSNKSSDIYWTNTKTVMQLLRKYKILNLL
jgi:hypothetical protein